MTISLKEIKTGMSGGPEAIMQNFNALNNELGRMNGSVVEIPKEQFTALNGLNIDRNSAKGFIFKFNNFAIISLSAYVSNATAKAWNYKEAVSIPKDYLNGYSKFQYFGDTRRITDENWIYDANFDVVKGLLAFYTRGHDYNNKGLGIDVVGILYN